VVRFVDIGAFIGHHL